MTLRFDVHTLVQLRGIVAHQPAPDSFPWRCCRHDMIRRGARGRPAVRLLQRVRHAGEHAGVAGFLAEMDEVRKVGLFITSNLSVRSVKSQTMADLVDLE